MNANTTPVSTLRQWLELRLQASTRGALDAMAVLPAEASTARNEDASLLECLAVLDVLRADEEILLVAILHEHPAWATQVASLPGPVRTRVQALLEGQQAAAQVWSLHAQSGTGRAEGLRRLLLALVRDPRVILVLLARQLVALRRAASLPEAERVQLARLTADIHAPLANRLGIWQLKWELEDLAFRYLQPETYQRIARLLDEKRGSRERFIEDAKTRIRTALVDAGIHADVAGRPKHIYSIWKKMQRKDVPFSELYDVRAVRVLVDDVGACYAALGAIHQLWPPVPSEFDDYIANPKGNQYRSLHTAVIGPEGRALEVQIRTSEMHAHAELGVAAHWRYKETGSGPGAGASGAANMGFDRKVAWMRQLLERNDPDAGDAVLDAGLRSDLVEDRIYLLTPKGEVIDLPRGGTVLDFAYHVHTEVGHRCRGAKVNGRIVPLTFRPATGDRVEIMTAKTGEPRRDWLMASQGFLASGRARDKVRAWFHKLDRARNLQAGRELLERELKRLALNSAELAPVLLRFHLDSIEDLHVAVALGDVGPSQVARALHEHAQVQQRKLPARPEPRERAARPSDRFVVEGVGNLMTQLARCCQPVAGDAIAGYLTRARGVSIHRENCAALQRLIATHPERELPVEWGERGAASYAVDVLIRGLDRPTLLKDLSNLIAQHGAHVLSVNSRNDPARGLAELRFTLKVRDFEQLGQLLSRVHAVAGVHEARRT